MSADPTAMLVAGPASGAPSSAVSVYADGFGIDVGPVRGTDLVRLEARGPAPSGPGVGGAGAREERSRSAEPLLGGKSVTVLSDFGNVILWRPARRAAGRSRSARQGSSTSPRRLSSRPIAGASVLCRRRRARPALRRDNRRRHLPDPGRGERSRRRATSSRSPLAGTSPVGSGWDGTDVTLTTPGDATLNGAVFGSKSVTIDPANIFINANLTSGGTLDLTATDAIDIANAVTVRSDFHWGRLRRHDAGRHDDQGRSDLADRRRSERRSADQQGERLCRRRRPDAGDPPGHERLDRPQGPEGRSPVGR